MRRPCLLVLACLTLLLAGCANLGPKSVQAGRADYNTVLRDTADQQLLENLVRLRYRDRPFFLEVASVTVQFSYKSRIRPLLNFDGALVDHDVIKELEGPTPRPRRSPARRCRATPSPGASSRRSP